MGQQARIKGPRARDFWPLVFFSWIGFHLGPDKVVKSLLDFFWNHKLGYLSLNIYHQCCWNTKVCSCEVCNYKVLFTKCLIWMVITMFKIVKVPNCKVCNSEVHNWKVCNAKFVIANFVTTCYYIVCNCTWPTSLPLNLQDF